ncbi:ATP-binding protein [Streptomyces sp. NPDC006739]|uniref:ATP-binding protein n=1 Tax=Streptomyces sp. NPDC006739 TaxID=3364763 RepID=UPI003696A2D6
MQDRGKHNGGGPQGEELRLLKLQLAEALADALLIARSRGARLGEGQPADSDADSADPSPAENVLAPLTYQPPSPRVYSLLTLPGHDLASACLARRHVRGIARAWDLSREAADDLESITAELMANALEHSDSHTVTVTCALSAGTFAISVTDEGNGRTAPTVPALPRPPCPEQEHGRGLLITAALAARWGTSRSGDGGLTVWAEVGTTAPTGAAS